MGGGEGGGTLKRTLIVGIAWTAVIFALGLAMTLWFGTDDNARPASIVTYVFHALFYSVCLGTLFALMFVAEKE